MTRNEIKEFCKCRNEAVWSFDIEKFEKYVKKYFPQEKWDEMRRTMNDEQLKGTMAKMCCNITNTPKDVTEKAMGILDSLGWSEKIW